MCYVQVYLIVSKVGREEGGIPVQDVLQQLGKGREGVSCSVAVTRQYGTEPLVLAAALGSGAPGRSLECGQTP